MWPFLEILVCVCSLILAVPVLAVLYCFIYVQYIHYVYRHLPRPEPCHFLLGHIRLIQKKMKESSSAEIFLQWNKELGPVYVIHLFMRSLVMCEDAGIVKEVLTRSKYLKFPANYRGLINLYGARALGYGLVTENNHEIWMKKRALFNPAFHRKYLMGLMDEFNLSCDKLVDHLMLKADGKTEVCMLEQFERLTMEIIGKVGFGLDEDFIGDPENRMGRLMVKILGGMQTVFRAPLLKYSILPKDLRYKRELREAVHEVREVGRKCILDRIQAIKDGAEVPKDILTYILQVSGATIGGKSFDMEDMLDEFMTFFGAGQETTANCMAFTLLHLGHNPDVLAKLRAEVDSVVGGRTCIEYSDITKLQYMAHVLKESLRLNPPVAFQTRLTPSNMELCGHKVPKGSVVGVSMYGMGRNEKHFKNPNKFDPDRFSRDEDSPLFAFFPFSLGARSCIGQTFAMIETKVVMCKLLQRFNITLAPNQSMRIKEAITQKPMDGCKSYLSIREL